MKEPPLTLGSLLQGFQLIVEKAEINNFKDQLTTNIGK